MINREIQSENNKIWQDFLVFIMPIVFVILLDSFFSIYAIKSCVFVFGGAECVLSLILMYSVFSILFASTGRSAVAGRLTSIIIILITIINWLKLAYTGEPILFTDINFLKASNELIDIIDSNIFDTLKSILPLVLSLLLMVIVICLVMKKYDVIIVDRKIRIIMFIVPMLVLIVLFFPSRTLKNIHLKIFFDVDNRKDYKYYTYTKDYYANSGVLAGMYGMLLETRIFEPDNYNEQEIIDMLQETEKQKLDEGLYIGTPNILVVLSESFWDIANLSEVKFDKDVTPNFSRLKEKGILIDMISPSYGGLTANVEMQLLTGMNLSYYNKGYTPYLQLYNKKDKNTPSIVKELKNNGYTTKIISCTSESFYNRSNVYSNLGVDESIFLNKVDKKYNKGHYLSDEYLTNVIINEMNSKKEDEKLFCMTLTIQQHMPYTLDKYETYDIQIEKSDLNHEMEQTLLAYTQGVFDADKQLGILYDYIQRLTQPTIIVFFGDHLPYLRTASGEDLMSNLQYFNTADETVNNYRKYNTQALILSNYTIKNESVNYLSPDLLLTYILNRMNINLSSYYKYLNRTIATLPSYNYLVAMDTKGTLLKADKLKDDMKDIYLKREKLQYMNFIK